MKTEDAREVLEVVSQSEILGHEINIYKNLENPLFLAKDVANWIEHTNTSKMVNSVDEDEKVLVLCDITNSYTSPKARKKQEMMFLTEYGLYEVLMQSRKPVAKQFKSKIKQLLKSLRTNEVKIIPNNDNTKESLLLSLFSDNPVEVAKAHKELLKLETKPLQDKINEQEQTIEIQKPKVELADIFLDKDGLISVDDFAKNIAISDLGKNKLYDYLRKNKILMSHCKIDAKTKKTIYGENHNRPYGRLVTEGKMVWKPTSYNYITGKYNHKPYFTANGVQFMLNKLKNEGYLQ